MGSGADEVRMGFAGPYQSNGSGEFPSVDWQMEMFGAEQAGLANTRLISGADKAFMVYKGDAYVIPESDLASFRTGNRRTVLDLAQMRDWFPHNSTPPRRPRSTASPSPGSRAGSTSRRPAKICGRSANRTRC